MAAPFRIAIVGGGISGLAAAFRLTELLPTAQIRLFEACGRVGGVLQTAHDGGFLIEQSADNFITNVPWGIDLCRRLGLESELLETDEFKRQAFVVHRGKLVPVPAGFLLMRPSRLGPMLQTKLLSPLGKLRLLAEFFIPARRGQRDESLASFVQRRFGRQVFQRLVQPLIGGIYTADPERLSLAATMPRFLEMEQRCGSLLRSAWRDRRVPKDSAETNTSGARYGMFVAPRRGITSIINRLVERLPSDTIQLHSLVDRIERTTREKWTLTVVRSSPGEPLPPENQEFDAVIVAAPAFRAAKMLQSQDAELAALLNQIPYAGTALVTLAYRRAEITHPLDGFGFVVPAVEKRQILAASFSSIKFPGRAPADQVLIRVFIGGACQEELLDLPDERLRAIATTELAELLGIHSEPLHVGITRWPRSMPQYHVGHIDLIDQIESRVESLPGLALAGNAYHGVGIPNCIHSGEQAAEKVIAQIEGSAVSGWASPTEIPLAPSPPQTPR
jgi:protoporphyrinogen/coproporphyrinogen III oxidase